MTDDGKRGPKVLLLPDGGEDWKRFPAIRVVEEYWNELRAEDPIPLRSKIDPRRIEKALECAFILERLAPGVARFRLAGMHLNELMGMEVRGMPLTSCFLPDARRVIGQALERIFDEPAVARLTLSGDRGIGKPPLDARMVLLPLNSDLGETSRILGCLASLGPVGRTPRRFSIQESRLAGLDTGGTRPPGEWRPMPSEAGLREIAGFAEAAADFAPRPPRPSGGKPHLYLVKSDDS